MTASKNNFRLQSSRALRRNLTLQIFQIDFYKKNRDKSSELPKQFTENFEMFYQRKTDWLTVDNQK